MSTYAFASGVAATPSYKQNYQIAFTGTASGTGVQWGFGDTWTFNFTTSAGDFTLGSGRVGDISPTQALSCYQRIWLAVADKWFFCSPDDPTGWELQDVDSGSVTFDSEFGAVDQVQGFAPYQGRVAVFGTYSVQIWQINADPDQFARQQTLPNIGTDAPLSIQPFGELDVFFVTTSGFRSLRVRDQSLNAMVVDIGTPINSLVRAYSNTERQGAVGVMEPDTHRYWCFIKDTIHVLNYFPELKIQAWTSFSPQYSTDNLAGQSYDLAGHYSVTTVIGQRYLYIRRGTNTQIVDGSNTYAASAIFTATTTSIQAQGVPNTSIPDQLVSFTAFTPEKFVVHSGQIYVLATDGKVYQYGGTNNQTYDYCIMDAKIPWLDHGTPTTKKQSAFVDFIGQGQWQIKVSVDPKTGTQRTVVLKGSATAPSVVSDATIDQGNFPFQAIGTHIQIEALSANGSTSVPAKLSALIWRYTKLTNKQ